MATIQEIRQQFPQYQDLSNRELIDRLHSTFYQDIPKEDFESRIIGRTQLPELPTAGEIFARQARGAARDIASTIPLVGGFADEAEAAVRAIGPTTRGEELAKIREEQEINRRALEQAGVGGLTTAGQILGGIGAGAGVLGALGRGVSGVGQIGSRLGQAAQTGRGQVALGAGVGAIEGAGFGDEEAAGGALTGAAIGAAVPVVGRGIARAIGRTDPVAARELTDIAENPKDVKTLLQGIKASDDVAERVVPLAEEALEETENRVRNIVLDKLNIDSIDDIAAPAKSEFRQFMQKNADKKIPVNKVLPLYRKANVRNLADNLRRNNPDTLGKMPLNSVGFLQELKSTAAARGRTGAESAPEWREASKSIKGAIDSNFSGFRELNKKFAKSIEAEELANRISTLNLQEDANIPKLLLKGQNKRDLAKSFGPEKRDSLVKALRDEARSTERLQKISRRARNQVIGVESIQGSLEQIPRDSIVGLLREGVSRGSRLATGDAQARRALKLIEGGKAPRISPLTTTLGAQQLSRQTGE